MWETTFPAASAGIAIGIVWIISMLIIAVISLSSLGLTIWALVDVIRREYVRGSKKIVWILVIVLVSIIGPIVYFLGGRTDGLEEIEEG
ncbi:MAG: PLD nuclease N-terminal domain-containing protein [Dehalococcoidia bacterium]|nr:PLD nuclease N-terminal domain-containing protein [Dehalococcoidia bacterium]